MRPHDLDATLAPVDPEGTTRSENGNAAATRSQACEGLPDAAIVAQIVERHHAYERRALPYVLALLAKVAGCYRCHNAKLGVLCETGEELADTLEAHLDDEAQGLFPALLAGAPAPDVVRGGLDRMGRHHRALALLLARVRWLADDFAVPPWGGRTYQVLMEELEALERDVLEHMHLESAALRSHAA